MAGNWRARQTGADLTRAYQRIDTKMTSAEDSSKILERGIREGNKSVIGGFHVSQSNCVGADRSSSGTARCCRPDRLGGRMGTAVVPIEGLRARARAGAGEHARPLSLLTARASALSCRPRV